MLIIVVLVKRRRTRENDKEDEEQNYVYGIRDSEEYYELGENTEIVDINVSYYGKR